MLRRTDQDVAFWCQQARASGGPVLELACGTGRLTLPLAGAGVEIVGLDRDPVMLARARSHARRIPIPGRALFVAGDMRRFALARRFGLVFVGYNSLQLLADPIDAVACLDRAREHLAPGGRVGVEVTDFQRGGADGAAGPDGNASLLLLGEAEGIRLWGTLAHDLAARTSRYWRRFEGPGWQVDSELVIRSLDQGELEAMLRGAGLSLVDAWPSGATTRAVAEPRRGNA